MGKPTDVAGPRIGAFLIDSVIWTVVWAAALFGGSAAGDAGAVVAWIGILGGGIAYWVVLPGITGWTPGKRLLNLRVVRTDGTHPAGVWRNLLRQLGWIADYFPWFFPAVGLVMILATERNQRVGDMFADTVVVRAEVAGQQLAPLFAAAGVGGIPGQWASPGGYVPPQPGSFGTPSPGAAPGTVPPPPAPPPTAQLPADWYPDPRGEKRLRYWDGSEWTDRTAD